jgi:hypothetical protein
MKSNLTPTTWMVIRDADQALPGGKMMQNVIISPGLPFSVSTVCGRHRKA